MAIYLGTNKVDGNVSIETGNTVEYTPTISSGTELGKLSIDGVDSSIYAPSIPTNVSAFTNDAGYLTVHQDISSKIDTAGTGLSKSGTTLNHSNSITAGTIGTSSATNGVTLAVPYATYDAQGHITGKGTHTHTVATYGTSDLTAGSSALTTGQMYLVYE